VKKGKGPPSSKPIKKKKRNNILHKGGREKTLILHLGKSARPQKKGRGGKGREMLILPVPGGEKSTMPR